MLALVTHLTEAMMEFAPAHVRPPEKSLMRIYRDIRFSADKRPYKTHIAAWWTRDGLPKTSGAGFYIHISGKEIHIAAGVYMPPKEQLRKLRLFLLDRHEEVRHVFGRPSLTKLLAAEPGMPLSRVPKGFPKDHPAQDLVRQQQWGVFASLPAEAALSANFAADLTSYFRAASPLVTLLNTPLIAEPGAKRKPLFGLQ